MAEATETTLSPLFVRQGLHAQDTGYVTNPPRQPEVPFRKHLDRFGGSGAPVNPKLNTFSDLYHNAN